MSNIVPIAKNEVLYNERTLELVRRTVAADTNNDEFNLFITWARSMGLDPLRRQIYAFVFGKNDPKKRKMSIVVGIDGFRSVAERTGNYRPDEDGPEYETDASLRSPLNPAGLVSARVKVWKFAHGEWHRITGTVYWDEIAPIKDEWVWSDEENKRKPSGKKTLDDSGQWAKMPRLMLAKCAEAQALRKGWPDDFSNVYESAELDRAKTLDMLPSDAAEHGAMMERQERIGHTKDSIPLTFDDLGTIEMVPVGKVVDRCLEFMQANKEEPSVLRIWNGRNTAGLREFWAKAPNDALELKKAIEQAIG